MARRRPPLYRFPEPAELAPNEHIRALRELLREGGPALARRWLTALLRVDPARREHLVAELERRVAARGAPEELTVVHPPRAANGYVEHIERTYEVKPAADASARRRRARG